MEDILGWVLLVVVIAVPVLVVWSIVKFTRRLREKRIAEEAAREERLKEIKNNWRKAYTGATHVGKTTYDYNADKTRTTVTERATGKNMSYVHHTNDGPDLLTTMIVSDMLFNNKESSAGTVKWKDDVPAVTETKSSSWGLDDDDSRRSASSSFSSSDSSSSWDSGSISSDSGPSSDW